MTVLNYHLLAKSLKSFIFVAAFAALFGWSTALAQSPNVIQLSVRAGFDGYCKDNHWIPVKITVENNGAGVEAQIQLINAANFARTPFSAVEISLPSTSRKEFFVDVYPQSFLKALKVRVVVDGETLAETDLKINCMASENLLIGLLTGSPADYAFLGDVQALRGTTRIAQLNLNDLPDEARSWATLDALVVAGLDTQAMSLAQRQALELWLAGGGNLLVVGGVDWQPATAGLVDILPMTPTATQNVTSLAALRQYFNITSPLNGAATLTVGTLHPKASILVEQDGIPLLTVKPLGFGQAYFLAADAGLQPLSRWDGLRTVFEFALARKNLSAWDLSWNPNNAALAASALPRLEIPSILLSCCWMIIYLLVIGPLNYFFLRRIKRLELAWVSIPALVLVFTLIAYAAGAISRGTHPIVNRLSVILAWDGVSQSQVRGLTGVYSPNRAKYTLAAQSPFVIYALTNEDGSADLNTLQQGPSWLVPNLAVEIGGMKTIALDGSQPALALSHDLTLDFSTNPVDLTGRITNTTPYLIEAATLHLSSENIDLGDFGPGETKEINSSIQYVVSQSNPLFKHQPDYYPYNSYDDSETDTDYRRRMLSEALFNNNSWQNDLNVYLTGWIDMPALPVSLLNKKFESVDTNLVIFHLTPTISSPTQAFTLPASFMLREASTGEYPSVYNSGITLPAEGYFLRFWPSFPLQFSSVSKLKLYQELDPSSSVSLTFWLWNFQNQRWEPVEDLSQPEITLPNPEQYVGPGGEIRVRLEGIPQEWVYLNRIDFELTVNR